MKYRLCMTEEAEGDEVSFKLTEGDEASLGRDLSREKATPLKLSIALSLRPAEKSLLLRGAAEKAISDPLGDLPFRFNIDAAGLVSHGADGEAVGVG